MMPGAYPPGAPMQQQFLPMPYVSIIPAATYNSKRPVTIVGTVPSTATRFSVNLQCGPNTHPIRDDIALHLQFRFDAQVPYVARNHLQSQVWGVEEAHGYLSFGRNQQFELRIDTEHDHFKIYLNNMHFTDFRHRIPVQRITYLTIDGDLILGAVRFDGQPAAAYNQPFGFVNPMPSGGAGVPPPYPGVVNPAAAMSHGAMYPTAGYPGGMAHGHHSPSHQMGHGVGGYHATSHAIPMAAGGIGTGLVAGALMHGANKKAMKKQKKIMKKAMKPHKFKHKHFHGHGFGHHRKSGSSSSSSSSS